LDVKTIGEVWEQFAAIASVCKQLADDFDLDGILELMNELEGRD
jgi:hypothetical protein